MESASLENTSVNSLKTSVFEIAGPLDDLSENYSIILGPECPAIVLA